MTIAEIIDDCRIGGVSLEQRLAVVEGSTIPRYQEEARLILAYLGCRTCHGVGLIERAAECWAGCDDAECPYIHVPYTEKCPRCR